MHSLACLVVADWPEVDESPKVAVVDLRELVFEALEDIDLDRPLGYVVTELAVLGVVDLRELQDILVVAQSDDLESDLERRVLEVEDSVGTAVDSGYAEAAGPYIERTGLAAEAEAVALGKDIPAQSYRVFYK
jgi:hypothetical protein